MTIYIVGTNHELQHTARPKRGASKKVQMRRRDLQVYLRELVARNDLTLIAEEFSQQILDIKGAESIAKAVADQLGIEHLFCDPGVDDRVKIGLPTHGTEDCVPAEKERFDRIRENYWLNCLADVLDRDILFVCGSDHVHKFCELLSNKGITSTLECEYFGRAIYEA